MRYKTVHLPLDQDIELQLNAYGSAGWRFVWIVVRPDTYIIFFERQADAATGLEAGSST